MTFDPRRSFSSRRYSILEYDKYKNTFEPDGGDWEELDDVLAQAQSHCDYAEKICVIYDNFEEKVVSIYFPEFPVADRDQLIEDMEDQEKNIRIMAEVIARWKEDNNK